MDVLIAGAGPAGLALAIDLARRGIGVRIVDKATEFFRGSRGDGLQPRTLEVFDDLGVIDAVLAAGREIPAFRVHLDGEYVMERRMGERREPAPDVPYPNGWVLGQSQTEGILRDRLAEFGVRVELGAELTGFTQDGAGVTAELSTGETVRADYLVGADGGRSFVRKALGIEFEGGTDESVKMLLGDVEADLDPEFGYWFARAADPGSGVMMSPLPGIGLFQFGAPLGEADAEPTAETLQSILDGLNAGVRLGELAWSTVWRPNVRLAKRFREGRVVPDRRRGARPPADRWAGAEHERAGRLQPGLEAGRRLTRAAGQLRNRAARGGRAGAGDLLGAAAQAPGRRRAGPRTRCGHPAARHQLPGVGRAGPRCGGPGTGRAGPRRQWREGPPVRPVPRPARHEAALRRRRTGRAAHLCGAAPGGGGGGAVRR
ncbi:PheA/TfdB family FAD-binding monooxygenase [Amycolatopsis methanolica 239]|uniref:PheA/TfdB family FAD-binding monooxygenase n=1 Tax=Amycolatopsis methanolica 239 TaxID=1068978 RepID=A0A076MJU0_AMYME|nr:PheA/TfdB family FAD-binding monooxygenase [Amycolatopsis methanolica 239]